MTQDHALAFIAFSVAAAGTPGPSNTLLTATAANVGVVRGLPALAGVAVGMAALIRGASGIGPSATPSRKASWFLRAKKPCSFSS
jgi:threonine/homoserine/homoserine lactone efflux protein